jgi:oxalate decarboxylase/phosphoglucose isomerase-like protein (cupin superfamily)
MHITQNIEPSPSAIPGIRHSTLAGSAQGLKHLSVWDQVLEPGSATPPHRHDCEEVVLCSAGRGVIVLEALGERGRESGGRLTRTEQFAAGNTICIPRNAVHQILNTGDEPLRLVALFSATPVVPYLPDGSRIELPWMS